MNTKIYQLGTHMRTVLILLVLILGCSFAHGQSRILPDMLTLYNGESKVMNAPDAVRISVGKSGMISSSLLKSGEIVLIAEGEGETNMQVWFANGSREDMTISVVPSDGWRHANEIKALLGDIPGIKITTVGRRVVVDGNLETRDLERVNIVKERYEDMLILAREMSAYEQKMIYFDVKIVEFDRSETEELGINWSKSFAGPSLGYANTWKAGGSLIPAWQAEGIGGGYGYETGARGILFGIATDIVSVIDLLEQNGSALVLSSPRLSARSGGKADLTVGGEVPVITSSISGSSVEYKDYGVLLNMEPSLDLYGNITARIEVAITQLDLAQAVDGQPAFKKRATGNDIKLRQGDTLVLSGLITREEQVTYRKVKWLADIPVLGALFRSKSFSSGETEMVIFITPHILDDLNAGVNREMLNRVDKMIENHGATVKSGLLD
ncbi:MAG TPA: pilus assembly protein N-terminal domain-containing protein [Cellvibrionaceae bacterium]